jgi:hypothetical protein
MAPVLRENSTNMTIIEEQCSFVRELLYLQKLIFAKLAKKFIRCLWRMKFHYHGQKNLLWTLSALCPVHTFATCPPKNFNTAHPWSIRCHSCYMSGQSHSLWLNYPCGKYKLFFPSLRNFLRSFRICTACLSDTLLNTLFSDVLNKCATLANCCYLHAQLQNVKSTYSLYLLSQ